MAYPNKYMVMKQKKLLVIHQGALGDWVATFPGLLRLKREYGQIDVLCQGQLGRLTQYLDIAAHAYPLESAAFATLFSGSPEPRMRHLLKSYDAILLFSFSSDLEDIFNKFTKSPVHRIQPRPDPEKRLHITRHILDGLKDTGLIDNSGKSETLSFFSMNGSENPKESSKPHRILIHPGSGSPKKNWPLPLFIEVGNKLKSMALKPEFILGPAEYHLLDELNRINGEVRIIDDLIVLAKELGKSTAFVGNDSGVSHLSAFLGLPTVVIFGPSDPKRWAPMGTSVRIVGPDTRNEGLECKPCFENPDESCDTRDCMINLSPSRVLNALIEMI
jgi:heptosyltransferase-3